VTKSEIGRKYGSGHFQTLSKKLVVAEDSDLWLRLKVYDDAAIKGTFTIKREGSGEVQ